jgi:hypothetical protein
MAGMRAAGVRLHIANFAPEPPHGVSSGADAYWAQGAAVGVFGAPLRALVRRAKIVLCLRAFGSDSEWKISRLAPLLSAGAFVVAEAGGHELEMALYDGGGGCVAAPLRPPPRLEEAAAEPTVAEPAAAAAAALGAACLHYLKPGMGAERWRIAAEGKRTHAAESMAAALRGPLALLLQARGCQAEP